MYGTMAVSMIARLPRGFTLVEIIVVVAIITILATVVFMGYIQSTAQARDQMRQAQLEQLKSAIEAYREAYGMYPDLGCRAAGATYYDLANVNADNVWVGPGPFTVNWAVSCPLYIDGLVPDFIASLPQDTRDQESNIGFIYAVNSSRTSYKLINYLSVETLTVTGYNHPFARCPGPCINNSFCQNPTNLFDPSLPVVQERAYAVYGGPNSACW
jgi:prepilin-type N-terminal cleavage/methylation domain-containing protein